MGGSITHGQARERSHSLVGVHIPLVNHGSDAKKSVRDNVFFFIDDVTESRPSSLVTSTPSTFLNPL